MEIPWSIWWRSRIESSPVLILEYHNCFSKHIFCVNYFEKHYSLWIQAPDDGSKIDGTGVEKKWGTLTE